MTQRPKRTGFTIVELIIVILILGILITISVVGYSSWRFSSETNRLKSDLNGAAAAMESARTFGSSYPEAIPIAFTPSKGITLGGGGLISGTTYCLDATDGKSKFRIASGGAVELGTCADLQVEPVPVITSPAAGLIVNAYMDRGPLVEISSAGPPSPTLTFRWYRMNKNTTTGTWTEIPGANSALYSENAPQHMYVAGDYALYKVLYSTDYDETESPPVRVNFYTDVDHWY